MDNIIYFDCETGGTDPKKHGIIELAFIVEKEGKVIEERLFKMNPVGKEFNPLALDITGYTLDAIEALPSSYDIFPEIIKFLDKYINKYNRATRFIASGHRVSFDINMLEQLFIDNGNKFLYSYIIWGRTLDSFDLVTAMQWLGRFPEMLNYKLCTLCEALDVDLTHAHSAIDDIRATRECIIKIKNILNKG